jgi:hypothetical protein
MRLAVLASGSTTAAQYMPKEIIDPESKSKEVAIIRAL